VNLQLPAGTAIRSTSSGELYEATVYYTNTGDTGIFNFYITTQTSTALENVTVGINGKQVPIADVSWSGNQIIVSNQQVAQGASISIIVSYQLAPQKTPTSFLQDLFIPLVNGYALFTLWNLVAIFSLLFLGLFETSAHYRRRKNRSAKIVILGIWMLFLLAWVFVFLLYHAGLA
jgi:hypothetical protein